MGIPAPLRKARVATVSVPAGLAAATTAALVARGLAMVAAGAGVQVGCGVHVGTGVQVGSGVDVGYGVAVDVD